MSNMTYAMFENTLTDLRECYVRLDCIDGDLSKLSESEQRHAKILLTLCKEIDQDFGDE